MLIDHIFIRARADRIRPGRGFRQPPSGALPAHAAVSFAEGDGYVLEIEFDNNARDASHDFRPALPLIFKF